MDHPSASPHITEKLKLTDGSILKLKVKVLHL